MPKGINIESGSGVFNTLLNKLGNVIPELHLSGYNFWGSFTKLDERLARGDGKLDAENMIFFTVIIKIDKKDICEK